MKKRIAVALLLIIILITVLMPATLVSPVKAITTSSYPLATEVAYTPGDEVVAERGRASRTYYIDETTRQTVFTGSPEFTKSDGEWVDYAFTDMGDYYQVQHPWSSARFYNYYTEVWNEEFTEVKIYDDRWAVEYQNKQDKWTDSSFWNITRSYEMVSDGIKLYRTGDTTIGQRVEEYYYRNGSPCKITISQTCDEAQNIRFVWKPSGIVSTTEKYIKADPIDPTSRDAGLNYYSSTGEFVQAIWWHDALNVTDDISVVAEARAQGRKATVTFGGFAINAGGIAHLDPTTFYPDAHVESTSVDGDALGTLHNADAGVSWATMIAETGGFAQPSGTTCYAWFVLSDRAGRTDLWRYQARTIQLYDTSALPDTATITDATLSIYGVSKEDPGSNLPNVQLYASNPDSNTDIIAGDYEEGVGKCFYSDTILCNTAITYANWKVADPFWNDFVLNAAGLANISKTGVSKFGIRNANYDVAGIAPDWGADQTTLLTGYASEQGAGFKPKLVVTYTPAAPTNVAATDGDHTDKVVITWTKVTGATQYEVFRDAVGLGALGDVATYDDNGADAPTITAGNTVATDGDFPDKVSLSLAGTSSDNGTTHTYTVKAFGYDGWSGASGSDTGFRGHGALTYQWEVDRGGGYGDIGGATASTYDDSGSPAGTVTPGAALASDGTSIAHVTLSLAGEGINDGATNEYRCKLTAVGCAGQTSAANTGFRRPVTITYAWQVSAADSDAAYGVLAGAITDPYNDTTAPPDGTGRWYYCEVSATGAATQDSTHNRGYRAVGGEGEDPRDPDLVYLEIRPDLDETSIVGHGVPTPVQFLAGGIFWGYSLPVWSDPAHVNEELYLQVCVPDRWDGEHDIVVEVISALSDAGEKGNTYQIDMNWEKVTPNEEVVPAGFHSVSAQRYNLSDAQYYCYRDWFVIDYDAPAIDPIIIEDELALRIRLGQVGGQYTDLDGELIIIHVGVLFPRGDLLGHPGDVLTTDNITDFITEEDMEELAIEFGLFNGILTGWAVYFLIGFSLLFLLGMSWLAFWKPNDVLFMILAGVSIVFGFYWYDTFSTNLGLAMGLMLFAYALFCVGMALRVLFWRSRNEE